VDSYRSAAELEAVHHNVISPRGSVARIALELVEVCDRRRGERMVPREITLRLLVPFEQREIRDPEQVEAFGGNELLLIRDLEAHLAENFGAPPLRTGDEEREIVFIRAEGAAEHGGVGDELL